MGETATTTNAAPLNVDTSESYVVVTLDEVIPMWGEGDTRDEAIDDLVFSLGQLFAELRTHRGRLAPHLVDQLRLMERLAVALAHQEGASDG